MTQFDMCACPVTLTSATALADWNGVIHGLLSHGQQTPVHLGRLMEAEPNFAMGHAARGLFCLMTGRAEVIASAHAALGTAKAAAALKAVTPRETNWITTLELWLSGKPTAAIATVEDVLRTLPHDTLSAKLSHGIRFMLGDSAGMRRSVERILDAHTPGHAGRGYLLGCHAFTLEETGEYARAEVVGKEALTLTTDDAWGLHAVAHVYDMTSRPDCGIALIENNTTAWGRSNNFRYHVWWHKALLHMERGELDIALGLYDAQIRSDKTDDYRDISNATSLLMRLELEGMDIGPRWEELADFSENRVEDGCLVFADLHYLLALTGAARGAARNAMTARFARDATKAGEMPARVEAPGKAALAGLNAFSEGRYDTAFANLAAARPLMQTIGGSHAQRDVFERITIDSGLRAGRYDATAAILRDRQKTRGGHIDRFAATRFEKINTARGIAAQ
ncbi:tetratricopeptide repeat protein [uncultured Sulfitobacter sp.]|uniref:tetratricopeptide repeat protein n=1 Tax=uncultured Sulfitobacter sp. TaxID=191468 RepID=UPI002633156F|nr:tetratricopeptide repeat protein [uncultured Sulfitobacter sp.]